MVQLEISLDRREWDFEAVEGEGLPHALVAPFLSALLGQAMDDGMRAIRFGLRQETKEPFLEYHGPVWSDEPVWWAMVAPPRVVVEQMGAWADSVACACGIDASPCTIEGNTAGTRFRVQCRREGFATVLSWDGSLVRQLGESRDGYVARLGC